MKTRILKGAFSAIIFFTSFAAWSQLSGELLESSRPIVDSISYEKNSSKTGMLVFDIVVNREGKVVECIWNKTQSTVKSKIDYIETKNNILMNLKFSADNSYPPFQYGKVTINLIKEE